MDLRFFSKSGGCAGVLRIEHFVGGGGWVIEVLFIELFRGR